jgi:hypothetical protein
MNARELEGVGGISWGWRKIFFTLIMRIPAPAQLISSPHFFLALALANSRPAQHKQQLQGS